MNNLALLYESFGNYAKAEPLLERCLSICEDALGPDHPQTATALNNWAVLCMSVGQPAKAEPLFERSITISERVFGAGHPDTAISLANLCILKVDQGKFDEALSLERKSRAAAERRWANILSFASEGRLMSYQDSLTIRSANMLGTLGSSADLAESTLRTKGIVLDSLLEDETVARASRRPEAKANLSRLHTASRLLSKLQIEATRDQKPESLRKNHSEQARLQQQVDALQDSLAREVASGGQVRRAMRVSVADVQTALAKDAVLLEFVLCAHYLGSGKSQDRCGAVVIGNGAVTLQGAKAGEPVWIPLATDEAIQRNLLDYSAMMRGGKQGDPAVLRSLYAQLIEPILSRLPASIATLIVSADAELNFVSFATLLDAQERFLSERYSIRYVSSGRDLLHEPTGQSRSRNYAAFANPAFTEKPTVVVASVTNSVQLTMQSADRRDYGRMILGALPNTGLEVQFLRDRSSAWHTVGRVHVGAEATELEVKAVKSPYILHLATHGFFLPDSSPTNRPPIQTRLVGEQRRPVAFRNPMQRSGLALAGAQLTLDAWKRGEVPETENDGILMAQEVGTMDLKDTWLVVLSACDTGIGEARSGEGVLGLRRGFVQAGAQNLLMTLWPISEPV